MISKWRYFDDDGIPTFYHEGIETNADNVVDALNAVEVQLADMDAKLASLEAENASLRERTRWIPVSERLPEDESEVLIAVESVFEPHYHIWKAYHIAEIPQWTTDNGLYYHRDNDYKSVTHWMPLPAAPKEDE